MHRYRLERAFAALLLLWFAVVAVEPEALHSCPVHAPPASPPAPGATHARHGHDAAGHSHEVPERGGHFGCTCIGDCSAGGMAAGIPGCRVVLAVTEAWQIPVELPPVTAPAITAPAFLLPYANGPPAGRVA